MFCTVQDTEADPPGLATGDAVTVVMDRSGTRMVMGWLVEVLLPSYWNS